LRHILSRLINLGLIWKLLLIVFAVFVIIIVVVPTAVYYLRDRDVPDYSDIQPKATMTFLVSYDSGEDLINESTYTLKVAETDVIKDGKTCFHTITVMDPYPKRKVNAIIVGTTTVTLAVDESWRDQEDLRMIHQKVMQIDLPIVNTVVTQVTFSNYNGYPGWPYSLGDSWTYDVSYDPDTPFQPEWHDLFRAEVTADDVTLNLGGKDHTCFMVVHTLVETGNNHSPGAGEGAITIEYWPRDGFFIAPIKTESTVDYRGVETWTMLDADPAP